MKAQFKILNANSNLDGEGIAAAKKILLKSMIRMQELAKLKAPTNTGELKRSIKVEPLLPISSTYRVFSNINYAASVEYGSKPHRVPIAPLKKWAEKKLGDEDIGYAIAKKIEKEGSNPQPFFRPAFDQVVNLELPEIAEREFAKNRNK